MTPPKAERPFQGGGCSRFDRPLTNPETISAERAPIDRVDLMDPYAATRVERMWDTEDNFLANLQARVDEVRQQRQTEAS